MRDEFFRGEWTGLAISDAGVVSLASANRLHIPPRWFIGDGTATEEAYRSEDLTDKVLEVPSGTYHWKTTSVAATLPDAGDYLYVGIDWASDPTVLDDPDDTGLSNGFMEDSYPSNNPPGSISYDVEGFFVAKQRLKRVIFYLNQASDKNLQSYYIYIVRVA